MASATTVASTIDEALLSEVLSRVKQELTAFNLSMREQSRQQLEAERNERMAALDECREECTSLRDEVRGLQMRQDKTGNALSQQRKDVEAQLTMLKDYVRDNASVCADIADRVLSIQVAVDELQTSRSVESVCLQSAGGSQPQDNGAVMAELKVEREQREFFTKKFTEMLNQQRDLSDEKLAQGMKQVSMSFRDDMSVLPGWKNDLDKLESEVHAVNMVATSAVNSDQLELKVQELMSPIQTSMFCVMRELETLVTSATTPRLIPATKMQGHDAGDVVAGGSLEPPTVTLGDHEISAGLSSRSSVASAEPDAETSKIEQIRLLQEHLRVLQEIVPGGHKLKVLSSQIEDMKGSLADLRKIEDMRDSNLSNFSTDLHQAFEMLREEVYQRVEPLEAKLLKHESILSARTKDDAHPLGVGREPKLRESSSVVRLVSLDDAHRRSSSREPKLQESHSFVRLLSVGEVHRRPSSRGSDTEGAGQAVGVTVLTSSDVRSRASAPTMARTSSVTTLVAGNQPSKAMHSFPQTPTDFCAMREPSPPSTATQARDIGRSSITSRSTLTACEGLQGGVSSGSGKLPTGRTSISARSPSADEFRALRPQSISNSVGPISVLNTKGGLSLPASNYMFHRQASSPQIGLGSAVPPPKPGGGSAILPAGSKSPGVQPSGGSASLGSSASPATLPRSVASPFITTRTSSPVRLVSQAGSTAV